MNFLIFNLDDGSKKPCNLAELSKSLAPNCEILREVGDSYEAIGLVSHKLLVHFAVEWADYAIQNYAKKDIPEAQTCISLVKKWIEDSSSVSKEELANAANAAYAAAAAAAYAADYAADYAANAANAADYAGKSKLNEQNRQGNFILKYFVDSSNIY